MQYIVDHPYLSYLFGVMLFSAFFLARFNAEEFRINAKNYNKLADKVDEFKNNAPLPIVWQLGLIIASFLWPYFLIRSIYMKFKNTIFGPEEIED